MKKLLTLVLTLAMLLSLTACGKNADNNNPNSGNENNANQNVSSGTTKGEETPAPTQAAEATLETTKVRLLCAEDTYMALAILDAPRSDSGIQICDKDGNVSGIYMFDRYHAITNGIGLWLVDCAEWPTDLGVGDFGVIVTDSKGEERTIYDIEPMSAEEMEACGMPTINGYAALAVCGDIYKSSSSVEFNVVVNMFCNGGLDTLEQAEELFKFYAEDGTPLENLLPDYLVKYNVSDPYVNARIYQDINNNNLEDPDGLIELLKNSKPYMEYTGTDGTTWKLPLIQE